MLKWLLIPLGMVTFLVMAAPSLVVMGYLCLIIPGLVLTLVPTVFVYLFATWLIHWALGMPPTAGATLAALMLALVLGVFVMLPIRLREQRKYRLANVPDIAPNPRLELTGTVLIDWCDRKHPRASDITCDYLCAALLDAPGVTSVIRRTAQGTAIFRRGKQQAGELVLPEHPEEILDAFYKLSSEANSKRFNDKKLAQRALKADWTLRIADGDEIRREVVSAMPQVDWTVHYTQTSGHRQPKVSRLEIRDSAGHIVARSSFVQHFIPAAFFRFGFDGGSAGDGFANARFIVARSRISNQPRFYEFDPAVELLRMAEINEPKPAIDLVDEVEPRLLKTLDDPNASEVQLLIAPLWLSQFSYNAEPEAVEIMSRILLDKRIRDPYHLLRTALSSNVNLTPLRTGLATRYLAATETRAKCWYVSALVNLPEGTFAHSTPEERMIWARALTEPEAAPFLERLADQGEPGVQQALSLLHTVIERPWHARWRVLEGVRDSFSRAGTKAVSAIPTIQSLLSMPRSPLVNTASDRDKWLVALYWMGVSLDDLPHHIHTDDPKQLKVASKRIQKLAARFDARTS
ncbi:MAG: hypothetical protein KDB23_04670 [Planctomycetales bacterium]|nr:hypothetical protein [Planctomycetales bacterium]